jgi:hypothetical protein
MDPRITSLVGRYIESGGMYEILTRDFQRVMSIAEKKMAELRNCPEPVFLEELETWFRLINRTALTIIESTCYYLKQISLLACDIKGKTLDPEDRQKLEEKRADCRPYFIPTADNVRYAFKMFAYAFDSSYRLDCSGKEWVNFCQFVKKRNEITHPKTIADLRISAEGHEQGANAAEWFGQVFRELIGACPAPRKG